MSGCMVEPCIVCYILSFKTRCAKWFGRGFDIRFISNISKEPMLHQDKKCARIRVFVVFGISRDRHDVIDPCAQRS